MSKCEIKSSWWKKMQPAGLEKAGLDKAIAAAEKVVAAARKSGKSDELDEACSLLGDVYSAAEDAQAIAKKAKNKDALSLLQDLAACATREADELSALARKAGADKKGKEEEEEEEKESDEDTGEEEGVDPREAAKEIAEIKAMLAKARKITLSCAIGLAGGEPLLSLHRSRKPSALANGLKKQAKGAGGRLEAVAFGTAELDTGVLTLRAEAIKKFTGAACKKVVKYCKDQKLPVRKVVLMAGNEVISGEDDEGSATGATPPEEANPAAGRPAPARETETQEAGGTREGTETGAAETPRTGGPPGEEEEKRPGGSAADPSTLLPRFRQARKVWDTVSAKADADIERIKSALQKTYLDDPAQLPQALKAADQLDNLFDRYAAELKKQLDEASALRRASAQEWARVQQRTGRLVDEFLRHINGNTLLAAIDADNQMIPGIELKAPIRRALSALRKAIG